MATPIKKPQILDFFSCEWVDTIAPFQKICVSLAKKPLDDQYVWVATVLGPIAGFVVLLLLKRLFWGRKSEKSPVAPTINNIVKGAPVTATGGAVHFAPVIHVPNAGSSREEDDKRHQELLAAIAKERGIDPKHLKPLFEAAGHDPDIPYERFEQAIRSAVSELLARAKDKVEPSNDGEAVDVAIRKARYLLGKLDIEGALAELARQDQEEAALVTARNRGRARMKQEAAEILTTTFRHKEAIEALKTATELDPENVWASVELGDCYQKIGDVLIRKGAHAEALDEYRNAMDIAQSLAKSHPYNPELQHNLSICHTRVGDVLFLQDQPEPARDEFHKALKILQTLAKRTPTNTTFKHDLAMTFGKMGQTFAALGELPVAIDYLEQGRAICQQLSVLDPQNVAWKGNLRKFEADISRVDQKLKA